MRAHTLGHQNQKSYNRENEYPGTGCELVACDDEQSVCSLRAELQAERRFKDVLLFLHSPSNSLLLL